MFAEFLVFALRSLALLIEFHLKIQLYILYLIDQNISFFQLFFLVLESVVQAILLPHLLAHVFDVSFLELLTFNCLDLKGFIDTFHLELHFK